MKAINKSQYGAARSLLETLINNYPDSAFVSPAKLSFGDARYAEGSYEQAELEYRDFITFFPNRPEASEGEGKSTLSKERQNSKVGFRCSGRRGRPNITFLHYFSSFFRSRIPPSVIESCTPSRKFLDVRSDHHVRLD
jgi:hypothetical protein